MLRVGIISESSDSIQETWNTKTFFIPINVYKSHFKVTNERNNLWMDNSIQLPGSILIMAGPPIPPQKQGLIKGLLTIGFPLM